MLTTIARYHNLDNLSRNSRLRKTAKPSAQHRPASAATPPATNARYHKPHNHLCVIHSRKTAQPSALHPPYLLQYCPQLPHAIANCTPACGNSPATAAIPPVSAATSLGLATEHHTYLQDISCIFRTLLYIFNLIYARLPGIIKKYWHSPASS